MQIETLRASNGNEDQGRIVISPPKFAAPRICGWILAALSTWALAAAIAVMLSSPITRLNPTAGGFMVAWFAVSLAFCLVQFRHFLIGFLGGLLFLLAGWRIAGPVGLTWVIWPSALAGAIYVLQFLLAAIADRRRGDSAMMSPAQWQLTFLRIYFAYDMVPHFTEKLFAGAQAFQHTVSVLTKYGVSSPTIFVIIGGLCEGAIAVGLGMGVLTRVASLGGAIYFFIASMIGGHFSKGFIWNQNNGGWEYPLLMLVFYFSFTVSGGGPFSIDGILTWARVRRGCLNLDHAKPGWPPA
jgi:putative oxidoreductase